MECQYCNGNFSDSKLLMKHQKTKFCLKIQNKKKQLEEEKEILRKQLEEEKEILKKQLEEEKEILRKQLEEEKEKKDNEMETPVKFDFGQIQDIIKEYCKN